MKIIRWLLSHFFLILLIVVVIYSYMFWGNLAGEDTPAGKAIAYLSTEFDEVREFVDAVKAKQHTAGAEKPAAEETASPAVAVANTVDTGVQAAAAESPEPPAAAAGEEAATEAAVAAEAEATEAGLNEEPGEAVEGAGAEQATAGTAIEVPPASVSYEYQQVQVSQDSAGRLQTRGPEVVAAAPAPVEAEAVRPAEDSTVKDSFVPEETVEQLNNLDRHGHVIDPAKQSDSVRETWITARKSFYLRNYRLSEESYLKVIESTEDNFDAYGELGNVYFNQGKKAKAAEAYYEAAAILVRKGQVQRARSLMGLLRHLDRAKAAELQKLIDSAVS